MSDGNVMKYLRNNNDISWVCQFCGHPFRWEVQPQTIRHHLTMICKSVEDDVREAAAWFFEAECSRYEGSRSASTSLASNSVAQAGKEAEAETEGSRYDQGAEVQPQRFRHHWTRMCERVPEDVKESAQGREVEAEECSSVEVNWEPTRILDAPENNDSNFEAEAKVSSVNRTRREGSVQSGNKRHRIMPNTLPIAPEVEVLEGFHLQVSKSGFLQSPDNVGQVNAPTRTFVKVNKSGCIGRSLDITRFSSYNELRSELARMFGLEGQLEESGWQLVFVDRENDVLLLDNGPWPEFLNYVWYIKVLSPQEVQQMATSFPMQRLS